MVWNHPSEKNWQKIALTQLFGTSEIHFLARKWPATLRKAASFTIEAADRCNKRLRSHSSPINLPLKNLKLTVSHPDRNLKSESIRLSHLKLGSYIWLQTYLQFVSLLIFLWPQISPTKLAIWTRRLDIAPGWSPRPKAPRTLWTPPRTRRTIGVLPEKKVLVFVSASIRFCCPKTHVYIILDNIYIYMCFCFCQVIDLIVVHNMFNNIFLLTIILGWLYNFVQGVSKSKNEKGK